jgi:hypothetical protein
MADDYSFIHSFILLHSIVSHTGDNPLDIEFVNNTDI